ncbi:MAG: FecR domain-containing protein [Candidatus Neomarinimicrobiota bacterium]
MRGKIITILSISCLLLAEVVSAIPIGRVIKSDGTVRLKKMRNTEFTVDVKPGVSIDNGDIIRVEAASFAVVIFLDDKSVIKMKENTQFQFVDTENTRTVDLEIGTIINDIKKENRTKTFRVETPTSVASVKGTIFSALVDASGIDQFYGQEGLFEVFNLVSGQTVAVGPGKKVLSSSTGNVISAPAAPSEFPIDPDPSTTPEQLEQLIEQYTPSPTGEVPAEQVPVQQPATVPEAEPTTQPTEPGSAAPERPVQPPSAGKPFGLGLGIGSVTIDGQVYNQLSLRPELSFGKLGIGFDLVVYLDNEGNIRQDEWDDPADIVDKFLYVRWARKGDPFWIRLGSLDNVTLGYGGLLDGYSNMMEFPTVRQIGVNGGVQFGSFGTEVFLSNVKDFTRGGTLLGLRGSFTVSRAFPLTVGANLVVDINQFSGFTDRDDDSYPDQFDDFPDDPILWNDTDGDGVPDPHPGIDTLLWDVDSDQDNTVDPWAGGDDPEVNLKGTPFSILNNQAQAIGYSVDIGYPILRGKAAKLMVFAEWNHLTFPKAGEAGTAFYRPEDRNGDGITIPGLRASLFNLLNLSVEYRIKSGYFVPRFFDQSYDITRVVPVYDSLSTTIRTKDMAVFAVENSDAALNGVYGSAGLDLFEILNLNAAYTSMTRDTLKFNSFYAGMDINPNLIPKLSEARVYYQRNNDPDPFDFANPSVNTIMGYRVGYAIAAGVSLVWDFRQFYRDDGSGNLSPIKQTTIETAFKL